MTLPDRFWSKVEKQVDDDCWLWTGCCNDQGYPLFWQDRRHRRAHILSYVSVHGPVPSGLVLDHVKERGCTRRHCVNPAHLEPVTRGENVKRGGNAAKTHCSSGHAYDETNTHRRENGHRSCRACARAYYHNRKAALA